MSVNQGLVSSAASDGLRKELLAKIAALGERPFLHEVVQSPWQSIVDVEGLHRSVKEKIVQVVKGCKAGGLPQCLTVVAPPGHGKTHLLGWARQHLDEQTDVLFVYVPPYTSDSGPLENYLLGATIDALRRHGSFRQSSHFEERVREFLVRVYDRKVRHRKNWRHLGLRYGLVRWLWPSWQRLGERSPDDQRVMLQRALERRRFLEMAYAKFCEDNPPDPGGPYPDWDGFVAACLLACGDTSQRWFADRWFRAEEMPPEVRDPYHLDRPCEGEKKIRDVLFTLNRLLGQAFCLAFDQLEDMYNVFLKRGTLQNDLQDMARLISRLASLRGFCLFFMFQLSIWSRFSSSTPEAAPKHLVDRMVEGYGPQVLNELDDAGAKELVRQRMDRYVWKELPDSSAPQGEPFFPFREDDIPPLRQQAGGGFREFLQLVRTAYRQRLEGINSKPIQLPPIVLTRVEPSVIAVHDLRPVVIYGEHLPPDAKVCFGAEEGTQVQVRSDEGRIEVVPPKSPVGLVEVRVVAHDGRDGKIAFRFIERTEPPHPYAEHLDRAKFEAKRDALRLSRARVAALIGSNYGYIWRFEKGLIKKPPDEVFDKLARLYETPLADFMKGPPT